MKVTIVQVFEMDIDDEHYINNCLEDVINDLNGLYDNVGNTISNRCEYQHSIVTEINGESVMNDSGHINTKSGSEIILDGKEKRIWIANYLWLYHYLWH